VFSIFYFIKVYTTVLYGLIMVAEVGSDGPPHISWGRPVCSGALLGFRSSWPPCGRTWCCGSGPATPCVCSSSFSPPGTCGHGSWAPHTSPSWGGTGGATTVLNHDIVKPRVLLNRVNMLLSLYFCLYISEFILILPVLCTFCMQIPYLGFIKYNLILYLILRRSTHWN